MLRTGQYFVYIVECRNGTYYTGYTKDLNKRIRDHNWGKGAKYLRGKGPVGLVYKKGYKYYKNAVKAECRIKKLSHNQKKRMVDIYGT